jgi:hypothetical protein
MANGIPQFEEAHPVLTPQKVNSKAEGYEAFARVLGSLASAAESKTEELVTEQSQAMYANSVANAEQVKTAAQIEMLKSPNDAPRIARETNYTLGTINDSAYVNPRDRSRLKAYLSGVSQDVNLKAATTEVHQRQQEAAFTHYANWPDQLKAYQQALVSDPDKAEKLKEAMIGSLHGLASTGAITPYQAGTGIKDMASMVEISNDWHRLAGNPDATARDFHTLASNPVNKDVDNSHQPINGSTQWMIDYYNNDRSFQGVMADINNKMLPDPMAFSKLQPAQREHAILAKQGVMIADGMINSGEPYPALEAHYKSLSEKGRVLSYRDEATRNALGLYLNRLKNGNYLEVMGQTPDGNAIMSSYVRNDSAIRNAPVDDQKKNQMLLQNENTMVDQAVAYAEGHHIPSQYVQPIPQVRVAAVQNALSDYKQNPATVLATLGQYNKNNQRYLANAMKNPDHRMVVEAMSLAPDTIKPQDKLDFIAANQSGRTFLNKELDGSPSDKTLMSSIYSKLDDAIRLVGKNYDFENAQKLQNSMLTTTLRYAKYLAQKDNNIDMKSGILSGKSWDKYVDQAVGIYKESYQRNSGTNWIVNKQQMPSPLTDKELDVLADHVTNEGYKHLKEGYKEFESMSAFGRNPLYMIISPTNHLLAVDGNGNTYYSMPFTTNVVPYAQESKKRREEEKKAALRAAYERGVKQRLHVRLPEDANTP